MPHEICYVSANCNQTPTIADWGNNNLICYGSCCSVLIYNPNIGCGGAITNSLIGHTKRVNSVKWIRGVIHENELISGSADGTATVWSLKEGKFTPFVLKGHENNVNIVDGVYKGANAENCFVVTASMDSTVRMWFRHQISDDFESIQSLNFGYSIVIGQKLALLPQSNQLILACALDSSKIQLYVEYDKEFRLQAVLKGHEDWVRGLDFTCDDNNNLLLASSSQDMYIRIWKFALIDADGDGEEHENRITTQNGIYQIYVDSVLTGHEGWIYSVHWGPKLQLLSASLDKSMIIWELDSSNLWLEKIRVGEVGGNTLGFYGGLFGPDGERILAHSYHGAFHIWQNGKAGWEPSVTVGGHFGEVVDMAWEPSGEFLLSVSSDQTTRIHAPWVGSDEKSVTWHEIARPQVHGYDMAAIAVLSRYKFVSAAEEKVIRTFEAPINFIENFRRISNICDDFNGELRPKGASVPSLGLSNKAVYLNSNVMNGNGNNLRPEESYFSEVALKEPPTEETLLQNTLWPEIQKLYGHGYEVYCLATSSDCKYLASASKATTPEHAAILLWDMTSWNQVQKLHAHSLTVVQLSFSPDSQHLLSVSRDRRWALFTRNDINGEEFVLTAIADRKTAIHTRIIWCCGWTPDSTYFATGSRDGKIAIWIKCNHVKQETSLGEYGAVSNWEIKGDSVTALDFAPIFVKNHYLLAVGFESGVIHLYKWKTEWERVLTLDRSLGHHLTVKRLLFRPDKGKAGGNNGRNSNFLQLASCSCDCSVKIHNLNVNIL